jgi:hypothetical protein
MSLENVSTEEERREQTCGRSLPILSRKAELGPCLALGNSRVHNLLVYSKAYPTRCLDLLALVIETPGHNRLGAIFVCRGGRGRETTGGIVQFFVISPVRATAYKLDKDSRRDGAQRWSYLDNLDILVGRLRRFSCVLGL